jgi:hypothetical protein
MTSPPIVGHGLALLPSKQFAGTTCRVCKVIARRARDGMMHSCHAPKQSVGVRESLLRSVVVKATVVLSRFVPVP